VDHLAMSNWMFACVNTGEDDDPPEAPTPVPRPGGPGDDADEDEQGPGQDQDGQSAPSEQHEGTSHHTIARFFG
jgi:hypothetical protein